MHEIAWTFPARIMRARITPSSPVDIAPARVTIILPPRARWSSYARAAHTVSRALKCR